MILRRSGNMLGKMGLFLMALLSLSCSPVVVAHQSGQDANRETELSNTEWRLVKFQSMDDSIGTLRPEESSDYLMRLDEDGSVSMKLQCNRAKGMWSASEGQSGTFSFGPLAGTRALCPLVSMDERILVDAQHIRSFMLKDGELHLGLMADGGIYTWELVESVSPRKSEAKVPVASPENGGPRNWEVASKALLYESPGGGGQVIANFTKGDLLDNLGCEDSGDFTWCYVQELGGGPVGFVRADTLKPAITPDGSVATGPDDSALRAGQNDFDATGIVPCRAGKGAASSRCKMSVARAGGGYATVVVKRPSGDGVRVIYFRIGRAIGVGSSEASPPGKFQASKKRDSHIIHVGHERYEIPEAVVLGG